MYAILLGCGKEFLKTISFSAVSSANSSNDGDDNI